MRLGDAALLDAPTRPRGLAITRPADPMPICDWAEARVVLSGGSRPGRFRLDPYQRGMLEAMGDPAIDLVAGMLATQLGKSTCLELLLGYRIDQYPCEMLLMHASLKGLRKFIREKLEPMLLGDAALNARIYRNVRGAIPVDGFGFDQGYCTMTTAGSRSGLHGTTAALVIADEVDDYEDNSAVDNLRQRLSTFEGGKLVACSTPTYRGQSQIEALYHETTQEKFYVPCQDCGHYQVLEWAAVKGEKLWCVDCGSVWTETARRRAVYAGEWRPDVPAGKGRGFWLSQLYSLAVPLERTVRDAVGYTAYNRQTQVLAWPYEEVVVEPVAASDIRREERQWPNVEWVTVGVDVQGDRIEYCVVQFTRHLERKHLAARGSILRTTGPETWHMLRRELKEWEVGRVTVDGSYSHDWVKAGLMAAYRSEMVRKDPRVEIVIGYGGPSFDRPLRGSYHQGGKFKGAFRGSTDEAKVLIAEDLSRGLLTLAPDLPGDTEAQLCSERLVRTPRKGHHPRDDGRRWEHEPGRRNEALDCVAYAYMGAVRYTVDRIATSREAGKEGAANG